MSCQPGDWVLLITVQVTVWVLFIFCQLAVWVSSIGFQRYPPKNTPVAVADSDREAWRTAVVDVMSVAVVNSTTGALNVEGATTASSVTVAVSRTTGVNVAVVLALSEMEAVSRTLVL